MKEIEKGSIELKLVVGSTPVSGALSHIFDSIKLEWEKKCGDIF